MTLDDDVPPLDTRGPSAKCGLAKQELFEGLPDIPECRSDLLSSAKSGGEQGWGPCGPADAGILSGFTITT